MNEIEEYTEFVPVTESGLRWEPRSEPEARAAMDAYPAGGAYSDGARWDGITHLEKRTVRIERTPWERV